MANWRKAGDWYINQANLCMLGYTSPDGETWYIQGTFNGVDWITDTSQSFATKAGVIAALANYVGGLG